MVIKHAHTAVPDEVIESAFWNDNHSGTAAPDAHALDGAAHTGKLGAAQFDDTAHGSRSAGLHADSHARSHALDSTTDHSIGSLTNTYLVKNDGTKLLNASNTDAQVSGAVSASHARQHSVTSTSDHTSTATSGKMLKADANGLPTDATNTDTDVADAVTKKHSQNTDTALGSGCVAADHGTAATDMVVNVCYGTGDPPAANTTTEGAIFLKYTA